MTHIIYYIFIVCFFCSTNAHAFVYKNLFINEENKEKMMADYFLINRSVTLTSFDDDNFDLNEDEILELSSELKKILKRKAGIVWESGYGFGYYENEEGRLVPKSLSFFNRILCSLRKCNDFFVLSKLNINIVNNQKGQEYIRDIDCQKVYISYSYSFDCKFMEKVYGGYSSPLGKMFSKNKIIIGKNERNTVSLSNKIDIVNDKFIYFNGKIYICSDDYNFEYLIDKWIDMERLPNADFRKFPFLEGSLAFIGKGYVKFCNYAIRDCEFNKNGEMKIKELYCNEHTLFMYKKLLSFQPVETF